MIKDLHCNYFLLNNRKGVENRIQSITVIFQSNCEKEITFFYSTFISQKLICCKSNNITFFIFKLLIYATYNWLCFYIQNFFFYFWFSLFIVCLDDFRKKLYLMLEPCKSHGCPTTENVPHFSERSLRLDAENTPSRQSWMVFQVQAL